MSNKNLSVVLNPNTENTCYTDLVAQSNHEWSKMMKLCKTDMAAFNEKLGQEEKERESRGWVNAFQSQVSSPKQTFVKFGKLPLELQRMVWEFTGKSPGPRVILFSAAFYPEEKCRQLISTAGAPGILPACRESRKAGMKFFAKLQWPRTSACVYVSWEQDIVMFERVNLGRFMDRLETYSDQVSGATVLRKSCEVWNALYQGINRNCRSLAVHPGWATELSLRFTGNSGNFVPQLSSLIFVINREEAVMTTGDSKMALMPKFPKPFETKISPFMYVPPEEKPVYTTAPYRFRREFYFTGQMIPRITDMVAFRDSKDQKREDELKDEMRSMQLQWRESVRLRRVKMHLPRLPDDYQELVDTQLAATLREDAARLE